MSDRKQIADSLINFNIAQINKKQEQINSLPKRQKLILDTIPKIAKMGKQQRQLINLTSFSPIYQHKVVFMYNPVCPHCLRAKILIEKYAALQGNNVLLIEMDVTSKERTDYFTAVMIGKQRCSSRINRRHIHHAN